MFPGAEQQPPVGPGGIGLAAATIEQVAGDPLAHRGHGLVGQHDQVEVVHRDGRVGQGGAHGRGVAGVWVDHHHLHPGPELGRAGGQPGLDRGAAPAVDLPQQGLVAGDVDEPGLPRIRASPPRVDRPHRLRVRGGVSPDGKLLATTSGDRTVRLWDTATGDKRGEPLTGHTDSVLGVAFSPDGKLLATTSADQTLRLWDTATGKPHGERLTGHTDTVNRVAFSPDGALLATASSDRTLRLWDTATGKPHGPPLTGHADRVIGVAFSPDGSRLATSGTDGTVRLWNPSFDSWVDVGCTMVSRNLSLSEWNDVAPGLPYERTCPDLPAGEDAPPDAEAAVYDRGTTHSAQPRPVR